MATDSISAQTRTRIEELLAEYRRREDLPDDVTKQNGRP
jgi:hypothetical protein